MHKPTEKGIKHNKFYIKYIDINADNIWKNLSSMTKL